MAQAVITWSARGENMAHLFCDESCFLPLVVVTLDGRLKPARGAGRHLPSIWITNTNSELLSFVIVTKAQLIVNCTPGYNSKALSARFTYNNTIIIFHPQLSALSKVLNQIPNSIVSN